MRQIRVIPRLDIKGPNLVKGIHLEGLRTIGKPERFAKHYYENGADEIIYMDVVASLFGRNSLDEIIERTAREVFIPITVGGGLRSLEDIRRVLRKGADKVAINTAATARPEFVEEAAKEFGSSTIVISIEAKKKSDGNYECYTDNGREVTGIDCLDWCKQVEELGAGELLVTSIDNEGTGKGYDLDLTKAIADRVSIPVIACGGVGSAEHVAGAVETANADAVAMASILHYYVVHHIARLDGDFSTEGNVEFLKSGRTFKKFAGNTIKEIKQHLVSQNIPCRHE